MQNILQQLKDVIAQSRAAFKRYRDDAPYRFARKIKRAADRAFYRRRLSSLQDQINRGLRLSSQGHDARDQRLVAQGETLIRDGYVQICKLENAYRPRALSESSRVNSTEEHDHGKID